MKILKRISELIEKIYAKLYVFFDKLKDQIVWRTQRFIKGYAIVDVWNVDYWFINNCDKILKEFKEKNNSIPAYFIDDILKEERDPTVIESEKAYKEWMNIIDKMIKLLEIMKREPENDEDFKYIDKCKEEFFKLFSKYFWMIGY